MRFRNGVKIYHLRNSIHECDLKVSFGDFNRSIPNEYVIHEWDWKCSFGDFSTSIRNEYVIEVFSMMFSPTTVVVVVTVEHGNMYNTKYSIRDFCRAGYEAGKHWYDN